MKTKFQFILAVTTMFSGVFISILFGVNENLFKDKIASDLAKNQKINQIVDLKQREGVILEEKSKNWRYYQRFHFHSTGIGAMSLSLLILLSFSIAPKMLKLITSYMISVGGLLYPYVWLFAGLYGPIMGRTEAKESFAFFGYMGGVFLLGVCFMLFILIKYPNKLASNCRESDSCVS